MPLCLMQSLPGVQYALTDSLTVVVPDPSAELSEPVPAACRKEVREGRVAWHADSQLLQEGALFSYETLSAMCKTWRDRGLFSFIEVGLQGEIGVEEKAHLHRLKQVADWLILDASCEIPPESGALHIESWSHLAQRMKEIGKKVGLRLAIDGQLPKSVLFPWIAKVALELGAPGFLCIEGESMERCVAIVQGVQDILSDHPLSKDSARLIPTLKASSYAIGERECEVIDFSALDALLTESCRPFFGGVAIGHNECEKLFGRSLWQTVVSMIAQKRSASSYLSSSAHGGYGIPNELRVPLARSMYDLLLWTSQEDLPKIAQGIRILEGMSSRCAREIFQADDQTEALKANISSLLEQSKGVVEKCGGAAASRPSMIGSFFSSMSV
jgi:hypothetical protein